MNKERTPYERAVRALIMSNSPEAIAGMAVAEFGSAYIIGSRIFLTEEAATDWKAQTIGKDLPILKVSLAEAKKHVQQLKTEEQ